MPRAEAKAVHREQNVHTIVFTEDNLLGEEVTKFQ